MEENSEAGACSSIFSVVTFRQRALVYTEECALIESG